MTEVAADIAAGRAAWERLQTRETATYDDWIAVGRALVAGRAIAMSEAKCNKPVGGAYSEAYGRFLREAGLASVDAPERYKIIKVVENLAAVEQWRGCLSPAARRRCNHPSTLWTGWRRATNREKPAPRRQQIRASGPLEPPKLGRPARPIFWTQEHIRRAHAAMLDSRSNDLMKLARVALEAAIRNENDLLALLEEPRRPMPGRKEQPWVTPLNDTSETRLLLAAPLRS
jgi:hypothetical protein